MTVYSMTGYASSQSPASESSPMALGMEIRSVNSRFLDLSFRLSDELRASEPALREALTKQLKRGKVEVRAWLERGQGNAVRTPDADELKRLLHVQTAIQEALPGAAPLSVSAIMQMAGGPSHSHADLPQRMQDMLKLAATALLEARAQEGARLGAMITGRTAQLRALAQQATPLVPELVEQQRQKFLDRWQAALGDATTNASADETSLQAARDRALSEATAFAIRIDVAEEINRLDAHLDEIDRLIAKGGELGKRLDFLIQELHREANTLGSKSSSLPLTRISVDMKVLIEQMREQVQNIE
ncbi:YicC family protein [Comamonadaceae bacterium M7527]|nr:YicC family protein [Comamonadaceae bacterium M7527]